MSKTGLESLRALLEAVAAAFAEAQLSYVDLRTALLRLAQAYLDASRWNDARRALQPLLEDAKAPLSADARTLERESYLRPAGLALEAGRWEEAHQHAEAWLSQHKDDSDAQEVVRESYLRPARRALEAGQWEAVRQHIEPWLRGHKKDTVELSLSPLFRRGYSSIGDAIDNLF